jgi:putative acetyltransferase
MTHPLQVRAADDSDLPDVLRVHRAAFGSDVEADLVEALLADPGARPLESYVAEVDGEVSAHVLLTRVALWSAPELPARILAPLAVLPERQRQGLGTAVTVAALDAARARGVVLVVVLGDPSYYRRFGFRPLLPEGPRPPYPLDAGLADAWQTLKLRPGALDPPAGPVVLAAPLLAAELWADG